MNLKQLHFAKGSNIFYNSSIVLPQRTPAHPGERGANARPNVAMVIGTGQEKL